MARPSSRGGVPSLGPLRTPKCGYDRPGTQQPLKTFGSSVGGYPHYSGVQCLRQGVVAFHYVLCTQQVYLGPIKDLFLLGVSDFIVITRCMCPVNARPSSLVESLGSPIPVLPRANYYPIVVEEVNQDQSAGPALPLCGADASFAPHPQVCPFLPDWERLRPLDPFPV